MNEHIRYEYQGAQFRIVSEDISSITRVYRERKRSCDDEWQRQHKMGVKHD